MCVSVICCLSEQESVQVASADREVIQIPALARCPAKTTVVPYRGRHRSEELVGTGAPLGRPRVHPEW